MRKFACPSCKQPSITVKDKYLAGLWQVIECPNCRARLCAQPIIMAIAYGLYFWAIAWWSFTAYFEHSAEPLIYLVPTWLFLDFLNINLMPLAVMRQKPS